MKVDDFKKKLAPKNRAKWNTIGCFKSYTYAAFKETYKKMDMYRLSTGWNRWIFSLFASCKRTVEWFDDLLDLTWPRVWWPDVSWQESSNLEIQTNGCRSGANVRRWLMENCRRVWELSNKRPGRRSVEFFTVDPRRWALMKVVAEIWG